jgi:fatty acid desaturase
MQSVNGHSQTPIPQRLNAAIVMLQLASIFACFFVASRVDRPWHVAGIAIIFGILMNSVYSIVHEAQHAMLFRSALWNESTGVLMALFFPAPFHLIRQGHIGHHLRNRSDDEAFDLYFEGDNAMWRWMVWIGILTGLYYVVVVLSNVLALFAPFIFDRRHFKIERAITVDRPSAAFFEAFNPAYLQWIRLEGFAACVLHGLIIWLMRIPLTHYLALYGTFGFMWSAMQYVHHYGTERHVTRGARNLFIFRPIDAIWLNHNWHRTHHEHPTIPWIHLPALADDDHQTRRGFLPWEYLKMWRGPRKTHEHVQNKYAGRIIQ